MEFSFQNPDLFHSVRSEKNLVDLVVRIEGATGQILFNHGEGFHGFVTYRIAPLDDRGYPDLSHTG